MKNKMFKIWAVLMVSLLVLLTSVVGCSSPSTPAANNDNAKVYEFKFHHHENPDSIGSTEALHKWAKLVEEKANGKVKITIYPAQTLGKMADAYNMVKTGVADISWGFVPSFPGQFPITEGIALPMLGITSASQGSKVLMDLYNNTPEFQAEYKDVHVLLLHTHDPAPIGTTKAPVNTAADLKGLNIRVVGDGQTKMIQALGANPMPVGVPDLYQSLERGVIGGYALGWEGIESYKLPEISKYIVDCDYYVGPFWLLMNKQKWESLPPDVQKAFDEVSGMAGAELFGKAWDLGEKHGIEVAEKAGVKLNALSADEIKKWQELAKPIQDKWAGDLEAKGIPGKAILEKMKSLIPQYK